MKVYIEYTVGDQESIISAYDSEYEAAHEVAQKAGSSDEEYTYKELFDPECGRGEVIGYNDKWTVITEDIARKRSEYWNAVAEAIKQNKQL